MIGVGDMNRAHAAALWVRLAIEASTFWMLASVIPPFPLRQFEKLAGWMPAAFRTSESSKPFAFARASQSANSSSWVIRNA